MAGRRLFSGRFSGRVSSMKSPWLLATLTLGLAAAGLLPAKAADDYVLPPESLGRGDGVKSGRVERFTFTESKVFPETHRDGWVYVPAGHDGGAELAVMVFFDGHAYVSTNGQMRVPVVLDNLIARGEVPPMAAVFVNPGNRGMTNPPPEGWGNRSNRSFEYDSMGGLGARFVIEELLPFVEQRYGLKFSTDPARRGICGMSSGGIAAWTVAWERPDSFGRVLSHIGSFVNIRGGHVYPALIRKTERKPIRVFLQDGSNDLNNLHGNWPLANQEMASALAFAGYDFKFVLGDGAHNGRHGGAILPDSLRWLWRPATLPPQPSTNNWPGDEALNKILADGGNPGDWELVGEGYGFTDAACGDADGHFYFSDLGKATLYRVPPGGKPASWMVGGPRISGMKFGADGRLYAASQGDTSDDPKNPRKKIVSIDPATRDVIEIAVNVSPNDLVVSRAGWIYFTDTGAGEVVRVPTSARSMSRPPAAAGGIKSPNGIALSPDQRQLWVSEYGGTHVWGFLVDADGELRGGERYMTLRNPPERADSGGDGMTVDAQGRVYVTSHLGVQMFDWTGRLGGVIGRPQNKGAVSCAFAGPGGSYLYVCNADRVYRRRTLTKAAPAR